MCLLSNWIIDLATGSPASPVLFNESHLWQSDRNVDKGSQGQHSQFFNAKGQHGQLFNARPALQCQGPAWPALQCQACSSMPGLLFNARPALQCQGLHVMLFHVNGQHAMSRANMACSSMLRATGPLLKAADQDKCSTELPCVYVS